MQKKKLSKYQIGNPIELTYEEWLKAKNIEHSTEALNQYNSYLDLLAYSSDISADTVLPEVAKLNTANDAIKKGYELNPDGKYRKTEITEDPNNLVYSGFFQALNPLLDITRLVGGTINDYKNSQYERNKLLKAQYPDSMYNMHPNGLNNIPVMVQKGGKVGKAKDDKSLAAAILNQGSLNGKKLTAKQKKHFNYVLEGRIKMDGHTKDAKKKGTYQDGGKLQESLKNQNAGVDISLDFINKIQQVQKVYNYIYRNDKKALDNFNNPETYQFRQINPQTIFNYLHNKKDNKYKLNNIILEDAIKSTGVKKFEDGGNINETGYLPEFESSNNLFNIIPSNNITMDGVPQDLLAIPNNGKPQILPANSGKYNFKGASAVFEMPIQSFLEGGEVPEVTGVPRDQAVAELEKGEVFQQNSGNIVKIADDEPRHEDGGSYQGDVDRVLHNSKRRSEKYLMLTPLEAHAITGYKPKRTVTYSEAHEVAKEGLRKDVSKIEKLIDKNLDYVKYSNGGKYAQTSLEENLKLLSQMDTEDRIFDDLFNDQERRKAAKYKVKNEEEGEVYFDNEENEMKCGGKVRGRKFQDGGDIPPYSWTDIKQRDLHLKRYYDQLKLIGYTGPMKIGDMQKFMAKNYTNLVQDYMAFRGIPDTNKGKKLRETGDYTPVDAFTDNLWWYRSMLPVNKYFKTEEDKNDFLKNMIVATKQGDINYYTDPNSKAFQRIYYNPIVGDAPADYTDPSSLPTPGVVDIVENTPRKIELASIRPEQPRTPPEIDPMLASQRALIETKNIVPTEQQQFVQPTGVEPSVFNEPLRWYDIASPMLKLLDAADREPVGLEQLKRDPLQARLLNPLPTLLQNQGDFNAALEQLPTSGVGFANQANLLASKYKVNNEILGQYENQNQQIVDRMNQYNDQTQFQVEQINMNRRDQFIDKVLQAKDNQRLAKLTALDDLFTRVAQNRKLNREGNLIMQLYPYFDQFGKFNGNVYNVVPAANNTVNIVEKATGKVVKNTTQSQFDKEQTMAAQAVLNAQRNYNRR